MHIGHVISGAGHLGLIGWALLGAVFQPDPPPAEVRDVSIVSAQEFEAILAAQRPADSTAPDPVAPAPEPEPPAPEPVPALAALPDTAPEQDTRPVPRPADRVAPDPVAEPDPEADVADSVQEAVREEEAGTDTAQAQEATAPEAATTEVVTEADAPAAAPLASIRPPSRPSRLQAPDTPNDTAPTTDTDAVAAALAEALAGDAPARPSGSPLTSGERDGLRVAVKQCWSLGTVSTDVLRTVITVGFEMTREGQPVVSSMRLISHTGGSEASAAVAYRVARSAIIRCAKGGYDLPADKFDQWRQIEITFNPERMQTR